MSYALEPRLTCEKKIGEIKIYGKLIKRYQLRGVHFPPGERFRLIVKWYNGEEAETVTYIANRRGGLVLEETEAKEPMYALCPVRLGERVEFQMKREKNGERTAGVSVVPFPFEHKGHGLSMRMELQNAEGNQFAVHGEGFRPQEHVELQCIAQGKVETYPAVSNILGQIDGTVRFPVESACTGELVILHRGREAVFTVHVGPPALEYVGGCCLEIH